jgi:hypothetical protein
MTRAVYQSMFIFLSMLLLAVLFVVQPTKDESLAQFQNEIKQQFATAAAEVLGDQNYSEPFAFVWYGVEQFYNQSTVETLALIQPNEGLIDFALTLDGDYQADLETGAERIVRRPATEEPVLDIVPVALGEEIIDPYFNEDLAYHEEFGGVVAGESIDVNEEEIKLPPVIWVTVNDSISGYPYCVGIFNGEINSYPGVCAEEVLAPKVQQN